jgi:hypothetical protein
MDLDRVKTEGNVNGFNYGGMLSILCGITGVCLTLSLYYTLSHLLNSNLYLDRITAYLVPSMEWMSLAETYIPPIGILFGIIGIFQKKKKKVSSILGIIINSMVVTFDLALMVGILRLNWFNSL